METEDRMTERTIPRSPGPEKAVLSVLLNYPERIIETAGLHVDLFSIPAHRILFSLISEMAEAGEEVEAIGLLQRLHESGNLEIIGGSGNFHEILTYSPNQSFFSRHMADLAEKHALREALRIASAIEEAVDTLDPQAVLEASSGPVSALHDLIAGSRPQEDTRTVLRDAAKRWESLVKGETLPVGVQTRLTAFNVRFRGLQAGHTIIVSGLPESGKSTLSMQLALDAALSEDPAAVLILTLEMSRAQLMDRCLAYASDLPGDAISDPKGYARQKWPEHTGASAPRDLLMKFRRGVAAIHSAPLMVEHMTGPNASQVAATIRRHHRRQPLRVVVLDYVQRMRARPGHDRDTFERVLADAAESLADLARELGFTLILTSQLSKDGAAKHAEAINEAADLHLKCERDPKTKEHRGIFIEKDRHHGTSGQRMGLVLEGPMLRFIPMPVEDQTPKPEREIPTRSWEKTYENAKHR